MAPFSAVNSHGFALRGDGVLSEDEGDAGSKTYMNLGAGLKRPRPSETDPPSHLQWDSLPLPADLDMTGPIELQLDAACTAPDTAFMAILLDVDEQEQADIVSAGYLRASLRAVDVAAVSSEGRCSHARPSKPYPIGEKVRCRIPIVPNSRRFLAGHKIPLLITTDDQDKNIPTPLEFRHASIGASSFNTVFSSSRLLLPLLK